MADLLDLLYKTTAFNHLRTINLLNHKSVRRRSRMWLKVGNFQKAELVELVHRDAARC